MDKEEAGNISLSKEDIKRKLDRSEGEPNPDPAELLGADLRAVETLDKAEKALNQKQSADEIKEETEKIIDSFVESAKKDSSDK
jgi:hypothetical protein